MPALFAILAAPCRRLFHLMLIGCCVLLLAAPGLAAETVKLSPAQHCATPPEPAFRNGAISIQPAKNWQPPGGHVDAKITPLKRLPDAAQIVACFQWRDGSGQPVAGTLPVLGDIQLTKTSTTSEFDIRITVPKLPPAAKGAEPASELGVPLATMRIIAVDGDNKLLDVAVPLGIQSQGWAFSVAVLLLGLVLAGAWWYSRTFINLQQANWFLRLISSRNGVASLSQFQIMLWTTVVAFSSIYVMVLSGTLIEISESTLTLLGIAGAATLLSQFNKKVSDQKEAAAIAKETPEQLAAREAAEAEQRAELAARQGRAVDAPRLPAWSDLIGGTESGETIDVTRLQMLLFTLITASFVLVKVFTGNEIPAIPAGYLILMGISNGVYIGSKAIR